MKLSEVIDYINKAHDISGCSTPYICGGAARDKYMGNFENFSDLDITTGDSTIQVLALETFKLLSKKYVVSKKENNDGHISIELGNLKLDFSSNFICDSVDTYLLNNNILSVYNLKREAFSRDFTCNALILNLEFNKIYDLTNKGFNDIKNKLIRTCMSPEKTLTSKNNRVVRALYLACKLDFKLEKSLYEFLKEHPMSIAVASETAIASKLNYCFEHHPDKITKYLDEFKLWDYVPMTQIIFPYYKKHSAKIFSIPSGEV